jgi:hypothetical protein
MSFFLKDAKGGFREVSGEEGNDVRNILMDSPECPNNILNGIGVQASDEGDRGIRIEMTKFALEGFKSGRARAVGEDGGQGNGGVDLVHGLLPLDESVRENRKVQLHFWLRFVVLGLKVDAGGFTGLVQARGRMIEPDETPTGIHDGVRVGLHNLIAITVPGQIVVEGLDIGFEVSQEGLAGPPFAPTGRTFDGDVARHTRIPRAGERFQGQGYAGMDVAIDRKEPVVGVVGARTVFGLGFEMPTDPEMELETQLEVERGLGVVVMTDDDVEVGGAVDDFVGRHGLLPLRGVWKSAIALFGEVAGLDPAALGQAGGLAA